MIIRIAVMALALCVVMQGNLSAQTFSPNTFNMGQAGLGVPQYFDFVYKHDHPTSARFISTICNGYAGIHTKWMRKSDSTDIHDVLIPAGETVVGVLQLIPYEIGPLTTSCGVLLMDSLGQEVGNSGYAFSGFVAKSPNNAISVSDLAFGSVEPASTVGRNIVISNTGSGDAYMKVLRRPQANFTVGVDSIFVVKAQDSLTVEIAFTPSEAIDYVDTVVFGNAYYYTSKPLVVLLEGSGSSGEGELVAPMTSVDIPDATAGTETTFPVVFVASNADVTIVNATLKNGTPAFSLVPASYPVVIHAADTLKVYVRFNPSTTGTFDEVLVVTTSGETVVEVALQGSAVISSVESEELLRSVYPNPSSSTVHLCGEAFERWFVIDERGILIQSAYADDQGRGVCKMDTPGVYMLVSERTGAGIPFVVLK